MNTEAAPNAGATMSSPPPPALLDMIVGGWLSQAVYVVAKLGIADLLDSGPKSAAELAGEVGADADSLHRVMRALASISIFTAQDDGRYTMTPLAEGLRSGAPLRDFAIFCGEEWHWRAWGHLLHSVRTGQPAFERVFGQGLFDYLGENPDAARVMNAAMTGSGKPQNDAVAAAYDFGSSVVVDIGGGEGALLAAILGRFPKARGILFDLPHGVVDAADLMAREGLTDRCTVVAGDFFEQAPAGGDVYVLKRIIHDWDDARARRILEVCRRAMRDTACLLLVEHVMPPGNARSWAKVVDLEMLVVTSGGRERTEEEFRALLASAGLRLTQIIPTASPISIIEAATESHR